MAPVLTISSDQHLYRRHNDTPPAYGNWRDVDKTEAYVVESWGEGFMLGALLIMAAITVANMRKRVLLHKLILLELLFAMTHGTFCFMAFHGYGWYLSSTAALLYCSYFTHNVVAWMKIKPFFTGPQPQFSPKVCKWTTRIYLTTLAMTIPVLIFEIFNNFRYFNNLSEWYKHVRPYEPLMRDPWWLFSCLTLFHVIRRCYSLNVFRLVARSPRFGIMLGAICLAIIFTIVDILASIIGALSITDGINPYWKLALVFKCLTDNIMLDDFKSVLQRLGALKLDGDNAMLRNSMNMTPNEKAGLGDRDEIEDMSPSTSPRRRSLSGRELEEGETLDDFGRGRRKQSIAAHAVGKFGMKIRRLPTLPTESKAERKARQNAKQNKVIFKTGEPDPPEKPDKSDDKLDDKSDDKLDDKSDDKLDDKSDDKSDDVPPWERVDFITAPNETRELGIGH